MENDHSYADYCGFMVVFQGEHDLRVVDFRDLC